MGLGRFVHDAHRITDSVTIISSCSTSPRLIVLFLLLWMLDILDPTLFAFSTFGSISGATCPKESAEFGINCVPKLLSVKQKNKKSCFELRLPRYAVEGVLYWYYITLMK